MQYINLVPRVVSLGHTNDKNPWEREWQRMDTGMEAISCWRTHVLSGFKLWWNDNLVVSSTHHLYNTREFLEIRCGLIALYYAN